MYYEVRVRHITEIYVELAHHVGDALEAVYPQADVCRQDLPLKIEASAMHPLVFMSNPRD